MDTLSGTSDGGYELQQVGPAEWVSQFLYFFTSLKQCLLKHLMSSVERDHEVDKHVTLACDSRNKQ